MISTSAAVSVDAGTNTPSSVSVRGPASLSDILGPSSRPEPRDRRMFTGAIKIDPRFENRPVIGIDRRFR